MIEACGLVKRYGSAVAVDGLSFTVRAGVVTGFLGPNGSGKSTTMRLLLGLDAPDAGEARISGRRYADLPWPLREVGSVLEARSFHPGRSAHDHLLALAQANDIPATRVGEVLDLVGLAGVAGKRAGTFSLGMGQRLGIAAALLGDPGLLVLDEPANGLDPEGIAWMRTLVRSLAAEGRGVLISSHLISEMALTADRVVVIGQGKLIAEASVAELSARTAGRRVLVRSPDPGSLAAALDAAGARVERSAGGSLLVGGMTAEVIASLAAAHGIAVHELTPQSASLEETYMELTGASTQYRQGARPGHGHRDGDQTRVDMKETRP
jgi:ABC-2 type transport system ATP-binding protein